MPVNALQPVLIAAPYQEHGGRQREVPAHELDIDSFELDASVERVAPVSEPEAIETRQEQPRQPQAPFLPGRLLEPSPRTMPGPQILTALIERMGGAGVNSGPGQLFRVNA